MFNDSNRHRLAGEARLFLSRRGRKLGAVALCTIAALTLLLGRAHAQNWAVSSGTWNVAGNWSPQTLPTSSSNAYIDNGGTAILSAGVSGTAYGVLAGDNSSGTLNISGGSLADYASYTGFNPNSTGLATISSGTWTNTNFIDVGYLGSGTLNISGGSVSDTYAGMGVESTSSNGAVTVSGGTWTNSTYIYVGLVGSGTMNISGGSVSDYIGFVGDNAGSSGVATVSGGTWTNSNLWVGAYGTGTLNISGGLVSDTYGDLGTNVGSSSVATVSGGTWSNSSTLYVGYDGTSTLNVTGTGVVSVSSGTGTLGLAQTSGSGGVLNLGAGGTAGTVNAAAVTGGSGTATVNFNETGSYTFAPSLQGSLAVSQVGSGTTSLTAANTYTGGTRVSTGALLLNNASGSATGTGSLTVGAGATLGGKGMSSGAGFSISGTSTTARATVLVGLQSASDTSVSTSLTLQGAGASLIANANLVFNLNSAVAGQGTQLNVGSTQVTFGAGTGSTLLTLNLVGTNVIAANTAYVLIAGQSTGGVDQYTGLTLGTGTGSLATGLFTPILNSGNNGFGDLNLALSGAAASYYGQGSYLFLYQNSTTGADDIEIEVVPEPGTWALLLGGLVLLAVYRSRRKKVA